MRDSLIRNILVGAALAVIAIAAATTATAQQLPQSTPQLPAAAPQPPANDRALRITPFLVMGDDYAPGAGVAFLFPLRGRFSLEAEAMGDRDAMRTGLSLLVDIARLGRFSTYLAGGAGVQRDEFHERVLGAALPAFVKRTEFAIGIGGGASVPIGSRWSYRADFRWYDPKAEWPESWRVYNGITLRLTPR